METPTTVAAGPDSADKRGPGRPRSARAETAIIDAVLDLLSEGVTPMELSVEAVAARAGVGKATIYRRWASKDLLLLDAIGCLKMPPPELAGTSVRDDLITLLGSSGRERDPRGRQIMPGLMVQVQRHPELHHWYQKVVEPRRERMREVLRRGIATGELRPDLDVEVTAAVLAAPMILQTMMNWNPHLDTATLPARIVDAVIAGAGPAADASKA